MRVPVQDLPMKKRKSGFIGKSCTRHHVPKNKLNSKAKSQKQRVRDSTQAANQQLLSYIYLDTQI